MGAGRVLGTAQLLLEGQGIVAPDDAETEKWRPGRQPVPGRLTLARYVPSRYAISDEVAFAMADMLVIHGAVAAGDRFDLDGRWQADFQRQAQLVRRVPPGCVEVKDLTAGVHAGVRAAGAGSASGGGGGVSGSGDKWWVDPMIGVKARAQGASALIPFGMAGT